eukprot:PhM_4_TR7087/c0_g1_i1/m.55941/K10735/GINS4, SLD5; GINS complex subunit 4
MSSWEPPPEDIAVPLDDGSAVASDQNVAAARVPLMNRLLVAWRNESLSTDLMPYPEELVTTTLREIMQREAAAGDVSASQPVTTLAFNPFDVIMHEVVQCKYILSNFLRMRLDKIFARAHAFVADEAALGKMSPQERSIVASYAEYEERAMLAGGLRSIPESLRSLRPTPPAGDGPEITAPVPGKQHVFIEVLEDVGPWDIQGHLEELRAGDVYAVPREFISELLDTGKVTLK